MILSLTLIFAHADTPSKTVRFTPWTSLSETTPFQKHLYKTVKRLDSDNGTCTATVISNTGHILSARHCLTKCMVRNRIFVEKPIQGGAVYYYDLQPENLKTAECSVKLDQQDVKIQIEATSPGLIFSMNETSIKTLEPKTYADLVSKGYTHSGDFVIFKVKGTPSTPQACVPLSLRSVQAGDVQQSLGYPGETTRPDGFNSDGEQMYYSQGYVLSSITENACIKTTALSEYHTKKMFEIFDNPTGFMTTLDAIHGSSGTSVMGPDNAVAGILTNVLRLTEYTKLESDEPENRFCEGSGRALSTATIIESLKKQGYDVSALSCP